MKLTSIKVKDLIKELEKQDPEKEVMIQQGLTFDYATVYTVTTKLLYDEDNPEEDMKEFVVIEYQ